MIHIAPWIHWVDRFTCMAVNQEWREAIRPPVLWQSCFGLIDEGSGFPFSRRFVRSMQSCWSQLKIGVVIFLPITSIEENALHQWLNLIPDAHVDSLTMTSGESNSSAALDTMISSLTPRINHCLRELDLLCGENYKFLVAGNIEFSALEELNVYTPFHKCFIRAPNLKRLLLEIKEMPSTQPTVSIMRTATPAQCYPRLETAQFLLRHEIYTLYNLQLKYYRNLTWPRSLRCVELFAITTCFYCFVMCTLVTIQTTCWAFPLN